MQLIQLISFNYFILFFSLKMFMASVRKQCLPSSLSLLLVWVKVENNNKIATKCRAATQLNGWLISHSTMQNMPNNSGTKLRCCEFRSTFFFAAVIGVTGVPAHRIQQSGIRSVGVCDRTCPKWCFQNFSENHFAIRKRVFAGGVTRNGDDCYSSQIKRENQREIPTGFSDWKKMHLERLVCSLCVLYRDDEQST